ncbi:MAG: hypothetical protein JWQ44_881, partial [Chthoniobacter sp.]|nr:hypothetical protein [Chthoniobacter sp.]
MEAREGWGEALVISAQAAEADQPGKGVIDDPAPGHEDKAAFGWLEF